MAIATEAIEETSLCPVCGGLPRLLASRRQCSLWKCSECSHEFSFVPLPSRELYDEHYHEDEDRHGNWAANPDHALYERILDLIRSQLKDRQQIRLLDIGYGLGAFLRFVAEREPRIKPYGLDFIACEIPGIPSMQGDFVTHDFGDMRFDVICNLAVIEHVEEPVAFARKMHALLDPGGLACVMTVDNDGLMFRVAKMFDKLGAHTAFDRLYFTHHFQHFTGNSLRLLLEREGFRTVSQFANPFPYKAVGIPRARPVVKMLHKLVTRMILWCSTLTRREMLQTIVVRNPGNQQS